MSSLEVSGILYECDGSSITASANGRTFGPGLLSNARTTEDDMVYLVIGELHVVLTRLAFDILRGVAVAPQVEQVVEVAPEVVEQVEEAIPEVVEPVVAEESVFVTPVAPTSLKRRRTF
jgi:hypothetical protein